MKKTHISSMKNINQCFEANFRELVSVTGYSSTQLQGARNNKRRIDVLSDTDISQRYITCNHVLKRRK